ncbi:FA53A protein, partial [Atractosteus spatula]|nr:FA53A protein [Atractosteus spatula]
MVTLITEKLQNQSLNDLPCKAYSINLHSSEKLNQSGSLFPYEIHEESPWRVISRACPIRTETTKNAPFYFPLCPFSRGAPDSVGLQWQRDVTGLRTSGSSSGGSRPGSGCGISPSVLPGWISELNLNENCGPPLAPPTKRHCRSLSEPDELARCRSPWKPGSGSKVWTPVSKRRCNSGGSATLQRCNSHGGATLPRSPSVSLPQPSFFSTSPVPRPSSASSGFVDSSEGSTVSSGVPWHSGGPYDYHPRRRLSLSQEHISDAGTLLPSASSTPTSTPELSRRQGLLRCRSQPCDVRWSRPSLDFLKMTRMDVLCSSSQDQLFCRAMQGLHCGRMDVSGSLVKKKDIHLKFKFQQAWEEGKAIVTLKNSKSLCSLDYEEDDDPHMKTIVSSPCDSSDHLMNVITPGSSPMKEGLCRLHRLASSHSTACHIRAFSSTAAVSESDEDTSDCESNEGGVFPLDCVDLDLEQIENN